MKKILTYVLSVTLVFSIVFLVPLYADAAQADIKAGRVSVSSGRLNVREQPSTTSNVVSKLYNGTYLTLLEKSGDWWYLEYERDQFGYCHSDYIKVLDAQVVTVKLTSGHLNVRQGAGTSYKLIDVLFNGDKVLQIDQSDGWSRIIFGGSRTGYVSSKYLDFGVKYKEINLKVPSYKQNDSRWANVKLGSSGRTMADIGCATTALAMTESFRTGTTIYPDAMAKKLKYTSSGSLYWPSNYMGVTSITNYYSKIYDILSQGKPVLMGLKTKTGAQHWVVITGYKGGDTLKATSFIVNDPGSKTRTNLQQVINAYPYFYKYIYY